MSSKIYLIDEDETLHPLGEEPYDSEDLLQRLLATHPDVLAGDQIDAGNPHRWLLVKREHGVPDAEDAADRWALDHLFLDQDGVPTLVEVKRSPDTRVRRRVAGQMLDYAANAVRYGSVEQIRARFEASCDDPDGRVAALVQPDPSEERVADDFWQRVEANLQRGRIRMLFVADRIPTELQRIVEFLNEQMNPAEVLAVEVKQYTGAESGGPRTLVPTVIGQTAEAQQRKSGASKKVAWGEENFFETLAENESAQVVQVARTLYNWAMQKGLRLRWGSGETQGSFFPVIDSNGAEHTAFSLWTRDSVNIQFQHMKPPFDTVEKRRAFQKRLNSIPSVQISESDLAGRPGISYTHLADDEDLQRFLNAFDWYIAEIRAADTSNA